jgi:hypothetical protein
MTPPEPTMTRHPTIDSETGEILQEDSPGRYLVPVNGSGELERRQGVAGLLRPVEEPAALLEAQEETRALIAQVLQEGRDYGLIPGTDRKTLLQPGAQRTAAAFGCSTLTEILEAEVDHDRSVNWEKKRKRWKKAPDGRSVFDGWDRETGTSVGLYRFVVRCRLVHRGTGVVVGEGVGICSSLEDRYVDRPRDLEHTILRLAKKRALVDAVLQTFAMSEQFASTEELLDERQDLPPEELKKIARGRYFALLAEEVPVSRSRELARHAYQEAHPQLPPSTADWELQHFERAVNEFERFGVSETLGRAVAWKRKQDPAGPVDLELLNAAVASRELDPEELAFSRWLRDASVSSWIQHTLRDLGRPETETGEEEPEEVEEAERGGWGEPIPDPFPNDGLPF